MTNIQFQSGAIDAGVCFSDAWEMLKRNYGMFLGISLVAYILISCIPCANVFILGPVMGGVYYVALSDMRGEPVEFGMMFKGFEKFVPLMVIGLIQSIPGIIGQILQYTFQIGSSIMDPQRGRDFEFFQARSSDLVLGGGVVAIAIVIAVAFIIFAFLWWAAFFFAVPLALEYDLGPTEALKLSVEAAMKNIGGLLVMMIFTMLIGMLGVILLCLGIFLISIPVIFLANAFAYRQVFPFLGQQFNMAPPPPTTYGFGGGQPGY